MIHNKSNLIFEQSIAKIPEPYASCRVTCYRDGTVELKTSDKSPQRPPYIKFSSNMYVNTNTGKVITPHKSNNRSCSVDSARRTRNQLKNLIRNNFLSNGTAIHAIATFDEPEFDLSAALIQHKNFIGRLRYTYPKIEYLMVAEPHQSSAWHFHYLLKSRDGSLLHISAFALEGIWENGFVKVRRIHDAGRITGYFTKAEKLERLHFYPPHARLYHCSKGVTKPNSFRTSYEHAKELVQDRQLLYSRSTHVLSAHEDGTNTELNCYTQETWARKDKKHD